MELHFVENVLYPTKSSLWVLECNTPYKSVYLVAMIKEELGKIAAVLSGDSGDQCSFSHWSLFFQINQEFVEPFDPRRKNSLVRGRVLRGRLSAAYCPAYVRE